MDDEIKKEFIIMLEVSNGQILLLGAFDTGEKAMFALNNFAENHSVKDWTAVKEPCRCLPSMYVVQPGKSYVNGHARYQNYKSFWVDVPTIPGWWVDEEIARALSPNPALFDGILKTLKGDDGC